MQNAEMEIDWLNGGFVNDGAFMELGSGGHLSQQEEPRRSHQRQGHTTRNRRGRRNAAVASSAVAAAAAAAAGSNQQAAVAAQAGLRASVQDWQRRLQAVDDASAAPADDMQPADPEEPEEPEEQVNSSMWQEREQRAAATRQQHAPKVALALLRLQAAPQGCHDCHKRIDAAAGEEAVRCWSCPAPHSTVRCRECDATAHAHVQLHEREHFGANGFWQQLPRMADGEHVAGMCSGHACCVCLVHSTHCCHLHRSQRSSTSPAAAPSAGATALRRSRAAHASWPTSHWVRAIAVRAFAASASFQK